MLFRKDKYTVLYNKIAIYTILLPREINHFYCKLKIYIKSTITTNIQGEAHLCFLQREGKVCNSIKRAPPPPVLTIIFLLKTLFQSRGGAYLYSLTVTYSNLTHILSIIKIVLHQNVVCNISASM